MAGDKGDTGVHQGVQAACLRYRHAQKGCEGPLCLRTKSRYPESPGCLCYYAGRWQDGLLRNHLGQIALHSIHPDASIPEARQAE